MMDVEITLRNPERKRWMTGFGLINRGMAPVCKSEDKREAPIHLFMSPPYSFQDVDPTKFNVGLTMCERDDIHKKNWNGQFFVPLCNKMDLILVPGPWQKAVFQKHGVKPPVEVVPLGHEHGRWKQQVRAGTNRSCLIIDRGRDHHGGPNEAQKHFNEVVYMDIKTPSQKTLDKMPAQKRTQLVENGRESMETLQNAYRDADVFLKWGREGYCYPILEAMSAGCLIITNCHLLPYIEDGKNALVFRTIQQLEQVMRRAEKEPLTEIKLAGQQTAASLTWKKSWEACRAAIAKHYKEKK